METTQTVGKGLTFEAVDLGASESVPRRWTRQAREAERGGLPPPPSGHGRPRDEDLARLRKENKALREAV
jgi:transposase-like protein